MILKAFRIQMYKCIIDSGWVEISPLTVLVGKNESGKTGLLKALHKFNPFNPEPYLMEREWPRGRRQERDDSEVVCTARFELTEEEVYELSILTNQRVPENTLEVTRDYAGRFEVLFPSDLFSNRLHPNEIDAVCDSLPKLQEPVGEAFLKKAKECLEEIRRLAYEGRFNDITKLETAHIQALEEACTLREHSLEQHNEQLYISQYAAKLKEITDKLSSVPSAQRSTHEYVVNRIPTFIYMSDYNIFSGTAQLDQVKRRKEKNQLTEEDKTLLTMMDLSGLDLEDEVRKGYFTDREQRQYDLDDASAALTQAISGGWTQRRYEVQFRADGQLFYTFVKDELDPYLVQLEERSRGFQWFFSFDLMLMYGSKGHFKNSVILLDEPGLHLHPDAQIDLLRRIKEYTRENTLIYTTHLPFMIDLESPKSIRVLSETENGTVVTDNLIQGQPEAKFVLQAALELKARSGRMIAQRNLVVEGLDDFWIVSELSRLIQRLGDDGLLEDIVITPAGGVEEAVYIAVLMAGQGSDVVLLLDSNEAGQDAKERLIKDWFTGYESNHAQVLMLDECIGVKGRELSIEDIFSEKFYADRVQEVYRKQLASLGHEKLDLVGNGPISKRVENAFERYGLKFDRLSVARQIRLALSRMQKPYEIPQETREMGRKLFSKINAAFSHESNSGSGNGKVVTIVK